VLGNTVSSTTWHRQLVAGLSLQRQEFVPSSVHVAFVVERVALGQVFLKVLQFYPINIIPPWLYILIYQLRDEQHPHWWPLFRDIVSLH
jgi:hypothetical protein